MGIQYLSIKIRMVFRRRRIPSILILDQGDGLIQYNLFFGGRECAINTVVGAAASPLCLVNEDNFVPNQVYPSVLLLSAFLRIRVWW